VSSGGVGMLDTRPKSRGLRAILFRLLETLELVRVFAYNWSTGKFMPKG